MSELVVGVTGAGGFVGQHVCRRLEQASDLRVLPCARSAWDRPEQLAQFAARCDAIVHLAALNRGDDGEIYRRNVELVERLMTAASSALKPPVLVFASSTQRSRDNAYGRSKLYGEDMLAAWADQGAGRAATALVIPNVFGPGCRPFYNSVVATFCRQLAEGQEPTIQTDAAVEFIWVGNVAAAVENAVRQLTSEPTSGFSLERLAGAEPLLVSDLLAKLQGFLHGERDTGVVPDLSNPLDAQLYATLRSHLPIDEHLRRPKVHADPRGQLCEIIRLAAGGQVFFSTTRPGVIRGNHYHTRKSEWFCVVRGEATIRLREIGTDRVQEIQVSGADPTFVSIPALHVHHIENTGDDDLLTLFWTNEHFNPEDSDTFFEPVLQPQAAAA